jgi:hypothetical protein
VVERRSGPAFVTLERPLPRFVEVRRARPRFGCVLLPDPDLLPQLGCEMANEPLGTSYENHDVLPRRLAALPSTCPSDQVVTKKLFTRE